MKFKKLFVFLIIVAIVVIILRQLGYWGGSVRSPESLTPGAESETSSPLTIESGTSGQPSEGVQAETFYLVQPEDTLWKIADKFYNDGSKHMLIFEANRDIISVPGEIKAGWRIVIPPLEPEPTSLSPSESSGATEKSQPDQGSVPKPVGVPE